MLAVINLVVFLALCMFLFSLRRRGWKLSRQILAGLVAGVVYGLGLQLLYGTQSTVVTATLEWTGVVAAGYINLLRMIIMPLVLVMMVAAVLKLREVA
ncbi:MAG: cation:dicarboxylase symporter family transporter, partial [Haliea sp.]